MTIRSMCLIAAMLCAGALFGFYFTMSFVIMPGFDQTEAFSALLSNQQIGRTTQQSLFFIVLLGTPIAIAASYILPDANGKRKSGVTLGLAFLFWVAMMVVTLTLNVPLNQALDGLTLSPDLHNLEKLWSDYSKPWQTWNLLRVVTSGLTVVFLCSAIASQKD